MSGIERKKMKPITKAMMALLILTPFLSMKAEAACQRVSPFFDYPVLVNFGQEIVVDRDAPAGTVIAESIVSSSQLYNANGGWFGRCHDFNVIRYFWLEMHYSRTSGYYGTRAVPSQTSDTLMYVMNDSGTGNPYGSGGSGSVGYTVELITDYGAQVPFRWVNNYPNKRFEKMPNDIVGATCTEAKNATGAAAGMPAYTGTCFNNEHVYNWRMLPDFSFRVKLYRLAGNLNGGVKLRNNGGSNGFALFSLMNNESTPPAHNLGLFNLTILRLQQETKVVENPCGAIPTTVVDLGQAFVGNFSSVGQPAAGKPDTPVNINMSCNPGVQVKWALIGNADSFDSTGQQGVLALDASADSASGVGVQLLDSSTAAPIPLTLEGSIDYNWISELQTDGSGLLMIDFLARIIKTDNEVKAGKIKAHATLLVAPK
tara:strand:+ start:4260 stop:5543 length:1284 start_codon:yes stop_codon:yes gene_type:complete